MTINRFILDTVAAVSILNGDTKVREMVGQLTDVALPIITVGEMMHGAENSGRPAANIERVNQLLKLCPVLSCDIETAREYARIELALDRKGRRIPQNDTWIAAIARQNNLTLVTRDKHFNNVDGLVVQTW